MHPAPGMMLTENLRLLRLLGRGGMGTVWLAEHAALGSEVAVKLLSSELAKDPEALERFNREATALAQLKTPHVVKIHDFGSALGTPFFVMERLEGEDLAHRLDRVHRLPIGTVTAIVVQTCKALARVHEIGVVHRDLKPANLFLTDVDGDLVVKLVDFGIAKRRDPDALHATSDSAVLGTPLYMSPEQVLSTRDVGPASDLYSLAVVAYECLVGEPPFNGETPGAVHVAIARGGYAPITSRMPSLPASLDAWFTKALAPVPEKRFASAREMADAFMAAARGAAIVDGAASAGGHSAQAHGRQSDSGSAVVLPVAAKGTATEARAPFAILAAALGAVCVIALAFGVALGAIDARRGGAARGAGAASTTNGAAASGVAASAPAASAPTPSPTTTASPVTAAATAAASSTTPSPTTTTSVLAAKPSASTATPTSTSAPATSATGTVAPPPGTSPPPAAARPRKDRGF